jgi:hypothetical protein
MYWDFMSISSDPDRFLCSSVRHQRRAFLFLLFKLAIIKAAQLVTTTAQFSSWKDIEAKAWNCTTVCFSQAQLSDGSWNVRCGNDSQDWYANIHKQLHTGSARKCIPTLIQNHKYISSVSRVTGISLENRGSIPGFHDDVKNCNFPSSLLYFY